MAENPIGKKSFPFLWAVIGMFVVLGVIFAFVLPKTSAPAPTATATLVEATATSAPTFTSTPTEIPPTPTDIPTATPTETPLPSPTPIPPLAMQEDGFSAWCYPDGQVSAPPSGEGISIPPEGVNLSTVVDGVPEVPIPNFSCNYVFEFNQKAPEGLKVEIYDWLNKSPVFNLDLKPAVDNVNAAVLYTTNAYLSKQMFWEYTYTFVVKDVDDNILWNNKVRLNVPWRPQICLAGVLPKATTMRCPLRQDSHPWDPWYGKTPVPNDDDNPIP